MVFAWPSIGYVSIALAWSAFQGYRGVLEHRASKTLKGDKYGHVSKWDRFIVVYLHDFAFRFVCTFVGFIALLVADAALSAIDFSADISAGPVTLLTIASTIAVLGIGGQLHYVILLGKMPKLG